MAIEHDLATTRNGDSVNDSDERSLPSPIRAKQSEYLAFGDVHANVIQRHFLSEGLRYIPAFYNTSHLILIMLNFHKSTNF